ncbi:MAG: chloride channel protein, partial [Clostridiales bacterium]|nr:chloride channel protein [Clostridiales bacterium]
PTLVAMGVCAFIGGAIRSPITAVVLIIEVTGSLANGLFSIAAVFASITVLTILRVESVNDLILAKLICKGKY